MKAVRDSICKSMFGASIDLSNFTPTETSSSDVNEYTENTQEQMKIAV